MANQAVHIESPSVDTYADLIIRYLLQINVEYIFGIPGGAIEPLYNAIARNLREPKASTQSNSSMMPLRKRISTNHITPIIARHEAGAAFMADGYARETGRLGVCCATTGPGATNLITGVASAYADRIPMLVITPQTALPNFGKLGFQDSSSDAIDVVGMFEHCTRYNTLISHPDQVEGKLYTALVHAFSKPRGPVHISIPMDILKATVTSKTGGYQVAHLFRQPKTVDEETYEVLRQTLARSKNNVLFIGGCCRSAIDEIIAYAERTNTPFVTTPTGKSLINAHHPLYRGVFGFAGHQSAYETVMAEGVEHVIAVSTSLSEMSTSGWNGGLLSNKLIHISDTPEDFVRSPMACLHLLGDIRTIFISLLEDIVEVDSNNISIFTPARSCKLTGSSGECCDYVPKALKLLREEHLYSGVVPIKPQRVMYELAQRFPNETRFIIDVGNAWSWAIHYLILKSSCKERMGFGFGAMGWAIGAAIGTALGANGDPVVCITGDGSYLMSGQELSVAVAEKLPMIFVVLNDQAYGMIKHGQRLAKAEQIGCELPPIDFAMMAKSVGAHGITIRIPEDFAQIDVASLLKREGPTLIDIQIDPEEVPPMGARIKTLNGINPAA